MRRQPACWVRRPAGSYRDGVRVLVAGGAGSIGSHVVDWLRAAGHQVSVLDALLPHAHGGTRPVVPDGVRLLVADPRD